MCGGAFGDPRGIQTLPDALPPRPTATLGQIEHASAPLKSASRPVLMTVGGAAEAGEDLTAITEALGAIVVSSTSGKGIVPDDHPLALSASTVQPEVQRFLGEVDVILAVGTELSETDSFIERIARVGVEGINPDFVALARACHCYGVKPHGMASFESAFAKALGADRPTIIAIQEGVEWLQ